jgi:hypothetical protein
MVQLVQHIQGAVRPKGKRVPLVELGVVHGTAIAGIAWRVAAGDLDQSSRGVERAYAVVVPVGDVEQPIRPERYVPTTHGVPSGAKVTSVSQYSRVSVSEWSSPLKPASLVPAHTAGETDTTACHAFGRLLPHALCISPTEGLGDFHRNKSIEENGELKNNGYQFLSGKFLRGQGEEGTRNAEILLGQNSRSAREPKEGSRWHWGLCGRSGVPGSLRRRR